MKAFGKEYAEFIQDVVEKLYFTTISVSDELNAFNSIVKRQDVMAKTAKFLWKWQH